LNKNSLQTSLNHSNYFL
jgi:hypothetical protein